MSGAVDFAAGLALLNLVLLALIARRVRQLGSRPASQSRPPWLAPGTRVLDFATMTTAGDQVSLDRLLGRPSLVGIFSTTCEPCREQVPIFASHAASYGGPEQALAVIVGTGEMAEEFVSVLSGKVLLVREGPRGPVSAAFAANALPAVYALDAGGRVSASGGSLAAVSHVRPGVPAARW